MASIKRFGDTFNQLSKLKETTAKPTKHNIRIFFQMWAILLSTDNTIHLLLQIKASDLPTFIFFLYLPQKFTHFYEHKMNLYIYHKRIFFIKMFFM